MKQAHWTLIGCSFLLLAGVVQAMTPVELKSRLDQAEIHLATPVGRNAGTFQPVLYDGNLVYKVDRKTTISLVGCLEDLGFTRKPGFVNMGVIYVAPQGLLGLSGGRQVWIGSVEDGTVMFQPNIEALPETRHH